MPLGAILVWDYITGSGAHQLELNWHIGVPVTSTTNGFLLNTIYYPTELSVDGGDTTDIRIGDSNPACGWRSKCYGQKEPNYTIQTRANVSLPHEFLTFIRIGDAPTANLNITNEIEKIKQWFS